MILDWIPGIKDEDVQSCSMGAQGLDVKLSGAARDRFPFAVEAKNQEKVSLWSAWTQCVTNAKKEKLYPLLVIKRNHQQPLAVISLHNFMEMAYRTYGKEAQTTKATESHSASAKDKEGQGNT